MILLLVGRRYRHAEYLLDRVADLVDLLQRRQEVDGARSLPVIELLAVEVHFEPAAVGRGEGDRRLAIVDRRELGRHTDGHGEVPSDDAVDDLDVNLAFGHGILLLGDEMPRMVSISPLPRNQRDRIPRSRGEQLTHEPERSIRATPALPRRGDRPRRSTRP